jgi:hypothetical protein
VHAENLSRESHSNRFLVEIKEWRPEVSIDAPSIDSAISHSRPGVGGEERRATRSLRLAELAQHGVDRVERRIYLLPHLRASKNNFSRHKDEEHDFRLDHTINETRE